MSEIVTDIELCNACYCLDHTEILVSNLHQHAKDAIKNDSTSVATQGTMPFVQLLVTKKII